MEVLQGTEGEYSWAESRSDPCFGAGPGCQEQALKKRRRVDVHDLVNIMTAVGEGIGTAPAPSSATPVGM